MSMETNEAIRYMEAIASDKTIFPPIKEAAKKAIAALHDQEQRKQLWHDAKKDPPAIPGLYYGVKDDTNSMWLVNYRNGHWTSYYYGSKIDVTRWTYYSTFGSDDAQMYKYVCPPERGFVQCGYVQFAEKFGQYLMPYRGCPRGPMGPKGCIDGKPAGPIGSVIGYLEDSADNVLIGPDERYICIPKMWYNECLTALRGQQDAENKEPCDFCRRFNFANARTEVNKYGAYIYLAGGDTQFPRNEQFNFCPVCGRPLKQRLPKEAQHED